jgi:tyrosinase
VTVKIELLINNSNDPKARYVSWAPAPCRIRVTDPAGATGPVAVQLANKKGGVGQVVFRATPKGPLTPTLKLTLPIDGSSGTFFIAGQFGKASLADRDAAIECRAGTTVVAQVELMVRIRKNANALSSAERDRFVAAFATLNDRGTGRFADFRKMHTSIASPEAHSAPGFLPWHRAYLLDLERELQAIDSSVALPYWRFDQAAPNVFTREFMGESDTLGTVQFSASNPLQFWKTDSVQGISRRPLFSPKTQGANNVLGEAATLNLGNQFSAFQELELNPHGLAHVSFGGSISSIPTAARDPLFFLLHANVDRLWAKWQWRFARFDAKQAASFDSRATNRIGHNLGDTMWPWNGVTTAPRPSTAPGGALASSACAPAPGPQPRVQDTLDYAGALSATARLGFDYDDVRFA